MDILAIVLAAAVLVPNVMAHSCHPPIQSANCSAKQHQAADICYREIGYRQVGEALELCKNLEMTLLPVEEVPAFYNSSIKCHHLGDGPFHVDALRLALGSWTRIAKSIKAVNFAKFINFNPLDCWDGATLAWYPNKPSKRHPYGQLRCHGTDHQLKAICVKAPSRSSIKLVGGSNAKEGNVFALNPATNIFGPVCDDSWDLQDAGVVCRELGYSGASAYYQYSHFGNVPADFSYDNVEESIQ